EKCRYREGNAVGYGADKCRDHWSRRRPGAGVSLPVGNAAELSSVVQSPWATPSDSWFRGRYHVRVTVCRVVNLAWWEDPRHAANNKGLGGNKAVPFKGVAIVSPCLGESGRSSRGSRDKSHRQLGPSAILIGARD